MSKLPVDTPHWDNLIEKGQDIPQKDAEEAQKHLKVYIEEAFRNQKTEVDESNYDTELQPLRPFSEALHIVHLDGRLALSNQTYAEMIMGSGLIIKSKKESNRKFLQDWWDDIDGDEKIEDALDSYTGVGNMLFEVEPKTKSDFVEMDIRTVKSIGRDKKGNVKYYLQDVNQKEIKHKPDDICHFKFTNSNREVWGRGLFHSIIHDFRDPKSGHVYQAPVFAMRRIEDDMVLIFDRYASPIMMFHFEDAGEEFIKREADEIKKARAGAKLVTDKKFDVEVFESTGNPKFASYVEHLQKNVVEPGSQFPIQMFNAGFTARAASETSDSVVIRKVKRRQVRLANQIKKKLFMPYIDKARKSIKEKDFTLMFEFENKAEMTAELALTCYRDNGIRRSEFRQYLAKKTDMIIDEDDMEDTPPITSVTPTNDMKNDDSSDSKKTTIKTEVMADMEIEEDYYDIIKEKYPRLSHKSIEKLNNALKLAADEKRIKYKKKKQERLDNDLKIKKLAIMDQMKENLGKEL